MWVCVCIVYIVDMCYGICLGELHWSYGLMVCLDWWPGGGFGHITCDPQIHVCACMYV